MLCPAVKLMGIFPSSRSNANGIHEKKIPKQTSIRWTTTSNSDTERTELHINSRDCLSNKYTSITYIWHYASFSIPQQYKHFKKWWKNETKMCCMKLGRDYLLHSKSLKKFFNIKNRTKCNIRQNKLFCKMNYLCEPKSSSFILLFNGAGESQIVCSKWINENMQNKLILNELQTEITVKMTTTSLGYFLCFHYVFELFIFNRHIWALFNRKSIGVRSVTIFAISFIYFILYVWSFALWWKN